MRLGEMVSKYVENTERVFKEIKIIHGSMTIDKEKVEEVIEAARRYLEDAKYYRERKRLETGLASVAYCEGLLDSLRFLGVVKFSWQAEK